MKNILLCCKPNALLASLSAAGLGYFMVRGFLAFNEKQPSMLDITQAILKGTYQVYTAGIVLVNLKGWYIYLSTRAVEAIQFLARPGTTFGAFVALFPAYAVYARDYFQRIRAGPRFQGAHRLGNRPRPLFPEPGQGPVDNGPPQDPLKIKKTRATKPPKGSPEIKPKKPHKLKKYLSFGDLDPKSLQGVIPVVREQPNLEIPLLVEDQPLFGGAYVPAPFELQNDENVQWAEALPVYQEPPEAAVEEPFLSPSQNESPNWIENLTPIENIIEIQKTSTGQDIPITSSKAEKQEKEETQAPYSIPNLERIENERLEDTIWNQVVTSEIISNESVVQSEQSEIINSLRQSSINRQNQYIIFQNRIEPLDWAPELTSDDLELIHFLQYHGQYILYIILLETGVEGQELFREILRTKNKTSLMKLINIIRSELLKSGLDQERFGPYFIGKYSSYLKRYFENILYGMNEAVQVEIANNMEAMMSRAHEAFRPASVRLIDDSFVADVRTEPYSIMANIDFGREGIDKFNNDPIVKAITKKIRSVINEQKADEEERLRYITRVKRQREIFYSNSYLRIQRISNLLTNTEIGWRDLEGAYLSQYEFIGHGNFRISQTKAGNYSGPGILAALLELLSRKTRSNDYTIEEISIILEYLETTLNILTRAFNLSEIENSGLSRTQLPSIKAALSRGLLMVLERFNGSKNASYSEAIKIQEKLISKYKLN